MLLQLLTPKQKHDYNLAITEQKKNMITTLWHASQVIIRALTSFTVALCNNHYYADLRTYYDEFNYCFLNPICSEGSIK